MYKLFATDRSMVSLVQRVVLAAVIFPHGAQKLLGWFGGPGFDASMGMLSQALPSPIAFLVILAESLGALALAFGLLSRVTAFGVAAVMVGAVLTVHLGNGFFMNWAGTQPGEGVEYHVLALALAIPLIVKGGGALSLDRLIAAKLGAGPERSRAALA